MGEVICIACLLRRLQHEEQVAGVFTSRLSLALDNIDLIEERLNRNFQDRQTEERYDELD
jgi:hypothetical protein